MNKLAERIKHVNLSKVAKFSFKRAYVGCIVLTQNHKILLQQRGDDFRSFPGRLSTFGGRMEPGETPMHALVRELREELGASVNESDVVTLGAITEVCTGHSELLYMFFWPDVQGSITGCYEGEPRYFDSARVVLDRPEIMDGVRWALQACEKRKLLSFD